MNLTPNSYRTPGGKVQSIASLLSSSTPYSPPNTSGSSFTGAKGQRQFINPAENSGYEGGPALFSSAPPPTSNPITRATGTPPASIAAPGWPQLPTHNAVPMRASLSQAINRFGAPAGQEWYHGHGEDLNAPGVQFGDHATPNNLLSTALYLLHPNRPSARMMEGLRTPPPTPWYSGSPSAPSAPYLQPGSPGMGYPGNVSQMDDYQRQQAAQLALMGLPL